MRKVKGDITKPSSRRWFKLSISYEVLRHLVKKIHCPSLCYFKTSFTVVMQIIWKEVLRLLGFKNIFKACAWGVILWFVKAKTEEKHSKCYFVLCPTQNQLCQFWRLKMKSNTIYLIILFWQGFCQIKGRIVQIF